MIPGERRNANGMAATPDLLRILLGLGLDYLRWVSLTPMVLVWALYLVLVFLMIYANFEGSFYDGLERGYEIYSERFGPIAWIEEGQAAYEREQATGTVEATPEEAEEFDISALFRLIMKIWGIVALAAWLLSILRGMVFGPRPPRTLGQKLKLMFLAVLGGWGVLFLTAMFGSTTFEGGVSGWVVWFSVLAVIVTIVSVVTLTVGQAFEFLRKRLEPEPAPGSTAVS